jgi:hypothetical protein
MSMRSRQGTGRDDAKWRFLFGIIVLISIPSDEWQDVIEVIQTMWNRDGTIETQGRVLRISGLCRVYTVNKHEFPITQKFSKWNRHVGFHDSEPAAHWLTDSAAKDKGLGWNSHFDSRLLCGHREIICFGKRFLVHCQVNLRAKFVNMGYCTGSRSSRKHLIGSQSSATFILGSLAGRQYPGVLSRYALWAWLPDRNIQNSLLSAQFFLVQILFSLSQF